MVGHDADAPDGARSQHRLDPRHDEFGRHPQRRRDHVIRPRNAWQAALQRAHQCAAARHSIDTEAGKLAAHFRAATAAA